MDTIYEAVGGTEGLFRLAAAWHARVMADEVVSHAFSHGFLPDHTERLAAYWAEALGGPASYTASYGDETHVVRIHSGNGLHDEMDQRAIACFDQALEDVGWVEEENLRQALHDYFAWTTTTTMARYHHSADDVPDGLSIPRWTWSGLASAGTMADVVVDGALDRVDWVQAKADLAADDFDNGRSPAALRLSFERSQHVALAWSGDRLLGMARLLSDGVCNSYLLDVWTAAAYRRRGIGARMVKYLADQVPGQHIGLQTDDAQAFYRSLGFGDQPDFMSTIVGSWLDNDANRQ